MISKGGPNTMAFDADAPENISDKPATIKRVGIHFTHVKLAFVTRRPFSLIYFNTRDATIPLESQSLATANPQIERVVTALKKI